VLLPDADLSPSHCAGPRKLHLPVHVLSCRRARHQPFRSPRVRERGRFGPRWSLVDCGPGARTCGYGGRWLVPAFRPCVVRLPLPQRDTFASWCPWNSAAASFSHPCWPDPSLERFAVFLRFASGFLVDRSAFSCLEDRCQHERDLQYWSTECPSCRAAVRVAGSPGYLLTLPFPAV
jgi:hypothetical protein